MRGFGTRPSETIRGDAGDDHDDGRDGRLYHRRRVVFCGIGSVMAMLPVMMMVVVTMMMMMPETKSGVSCLKPQHGSVAGQHTVSD
jgi:hypothetical protein